MEEWWTTAGALSEDVNCKLCRWQDGTQEQEEAATQAEQNEKRTAQGNDERIHEES